MDQGMYPYTKRYLGTFQNHFSTIGLVGMNECLENAKWFDGGNITTEAGNRLAEEILKHMRTRLSDYQERYGALFNLEATPAESTTYRFAKHDVEEFKDIKTASLNGGKPYYTNSSHLPVNYTDDIFKALEMEDNLQVLYTSGTVFHAFLGEKLPDWKSAASLVKKIAYNFKLPYFTLSPILAARITATSLENISPVRTAEKKRKSIRESPVTIVQLRIGTMVRSVSSTAERLTLLRSSSEEKPLLLLSSPLPTKARLHPPLALVSQPCILTPTATS